MPLPTPPSKRADLLNDYTSVASKNPAVQDATQEPELPIESRSAQPDTPAAAKSKKTKTPREPKLRTDVITAPLPSASSAYSSIPAPTTASLPTEVAAVRPGTELRRRRTAGGSSTLFVLDTNVLLHDPISMFRFHEHDIYLPMITLEELDGHKKGMTEVARNARQVSRDLDALAAKLSVRDANGQTDGLALNGTGHKSALGKLFFQTNLMNVTLPMGLPQGKADNQILGVVQALHDQQIGRNVVLVSKDINMRIKARALGLQAEDYFSDKTLEDGDMLHTGFMMLPHDFWDQHGKTMESWSQAGFTFYRISGPLVPQLVINQFVYLEAPGVAPLYAKVTEITGKTALLRTLREYTHLKNAAWGIVARNREQNFAMNLLMDPDCDFITLTGTAGTGKTLLTLAAGLCQVLDERRYSEIIVTRVTVPVGEDIGFLPGNEEEKMGPWMGALDDNLEVLSKTDNGAGEWGRAATSDLVRSKIKIKSMNFMRGRTFLNKFVIIDEAQNLTPKQMKTLVTRAGPGTKIVCLGNLAQIDTPYLTEGSSGLTYAVDRFKGWPHAGHITLARGERSRLADFASAAL
jgi:PhoH-like ATPase